MTSYNLDDFMYSLNSKCDVQGFQGSYNPFLLILCPFDFIRAHILFSEQNRESTKGYSR